MIRTLIMLAALAAVPVPDGNYVLVNGTIGPGEWDRARAVALDAETELRVMKDRRSLFLAIVFKGARHTGVDLYVRSGGRVRLLHVSSALGEKDLTAGEEAEVAWRNDWWTANGIGSVFEDGKMRWLEPEAFEFQLARIRLQTVIDLFIHLKRPEKRLPTGAVLEKPEGWLRLGL